MHRHEFEPQMQSQVENNPTPSSQNRRDNGSSNNRRRRDSRKSHTSKIISALAERATNGDASNRGVATQGAVTKAATTQNREEHNLLLDDQVEVELNSDPNSEDEEDPARYTSFNATGME